MSDFAGIEYNVKDKHIIIKNFELGVMRKMVHVFSHHFKSHKLKLTEKKYYTLHFRYCIIRAKNGLKTEDNLSNIKLKY